ncbi:ferredoxin [Streptomyces sp. NPDC051985]|uniref:ferredoxin n=1 Tax=Streptomyces sp. NPDC051985 TaxID=3155807 RepID=UPI00342473DC
MPAHIRVRFRFPPDRVRKAAAPRTAGRLRRGGRPMRVAIEPDRCVASGQCVTLSPTVFDQDDDGVAVLIKEQPDVPERESVREAIRVCPAAAIAATD